MTIIKNKSIVNMKTLDKVPIKRIEKSKDRNSRSKKNLAIKMIIQIMKGLIANNKHIKKKNLKIRSLMYISSFFQVATMKY